MSFRFESLCIDVHAPSTEVHESMLKKLKEKVLSFTHNMKDIVKAHVFLREDNPAYPENRICEIKLTLFGDVLFVHRRAASFETAAQQALADLEKQVAEQIKQQHDLPDDINSSVRV
jgi:Sigma 54 modulation protein / S30EA ribosomal protein.